MDDLIEISSDSDKTIPNCADDDRKTNKNLYELDFSDEDTRGAEKETQIRNVEPADKDLMKRLLKKYGSFEEKPSGEFSGASKSLTNHGSNNSIDLTDDSPERNENDGFIDELYVAMQTDKSHTPETNVRKREFDVLSTDSSDEDPDIGKKSRYHYVRNEEVEKVGTRGTSGESSRNTKQHVDKALKLSEREEKKKQLEKEKALKTAIRTIQKSTSPEECLKNIIVMIDQDILQQIYGDAIKDQLRDNKLSFKTMPTSNGLISWTRKVQTLKNMMCSETVTEEKHYLTIMTSKEFDKLTKTQSLMSHIKSIKQKVHFKHLTIVVFGKDKPNNDQEMAVTQINMFYKCFFQFAKNPADVAFIVTLTTKSVAKIPHKLEKEEQYKNQNQFFADCNKDSVRVDKNGNGLDRLWRQMLTMFPLARLETAEAIAAVYPTPTSLFKAYADNSTKSEELIQNIPIRRAQGPLTSVRKIGPELSKKCHNFFTSKENILL